MAVGEKNLRRRFLLCALQNDRGAVVVVSQVELEAMAHPVAATCFLWGVELFGIERAQAIDGFGVETLETHQRIGIAEVLRVQVGKDDGLCAIC